MQGHLQRPKALWTDLRYDCVASFATDYMPVLGTQSKQLVLYKYSLPMSQYQFSKHFLPQNTYA